MKIFFTRVKPAENLTWNSKEQDQTRWGGDNTINSEKLKFLAKNVLQFIFLLLKCETIKKKIIKIIKIINNNNK